MLRLVVSYRAEADGSLIPNGPPTACVRARVGQVLHRQIARLVDADPEVIAAAASRLGPLGPTREIATLGDERTFVWQAGQGFGALINSLDELNLWIASGGSFGLPARLAPGASMLAAVAQIDQTLSAGLIDALGDYPSLPTGERARLRGLLMGEIVRLLARYDSTARTLASPIAAGDQFVRIAVPRGVGIDDLLRARELVRRTWAAMGRDGGATAAFEPGGMGGLVTLMDQYQSGQELALLTPQTVDDWHRAARELACWGETLRLLRGLAVGRDLADQLEGVLEQLEEFAGVGGPGQLRAAVNPDGNIDAWRAAASSLLALRLQQVEAWPLPERDIVGAFGRALWSIWGPITGKHAPRRCHWRSGCTRPLRDGAHGNTRYCDEHKREAPRARAARNRSRHSAARGLLDGQTGLPPHLGAVVD